MTTGFKAVSPERAVQIMRAWAFHSWPMTVQDGIDVYTSFGFSPHPEEREVFTSDMSPDEADSYFASSDGKIDSVRMLLSNIIPEEKGGSAFRPPDTCCLRPVRCRVHRDAGQSAGGQGKGRGVLVAVVLGQRRRRARRRQ